MPSMIIPQNPKIKNGGANAPLGGRIPRFFFKLKNDIMCLLLLNLII